MLRTRITPRHPELYSGSHRITDQIPNQVRKINQMSSPDQAQRRL